jgi:hypothetical protein
MPNALIRPTLHEPQNGEPADDLVEGEKSRNGDVTGDPAEGESRGGTPSKPKSGRALKKEKSHGRKLTLPDSLFDRLQLYAIKKRKTVSAATTEVLDRNLPKLRIADE